MNIIADKVANDWKTLTDYDVKAIIVFFLSKIEESLSEKKTELINFYFSILSNCTLSEGSSTIFCNYISDNEVFGKKIHLLIEAYLRPNPQIENDAVYDQEKWNSLDPLQHMGSLLCNLCQIQNGREIILLPSAKLVSFIIN